MVVGGFAMSQNLRVMTRCVYLVAAPDVAGFARLKAEISIVEQASSSVSTARYLIERTAPIAESWDKSGLL
jgi:hypothetical protein